MVGEKLAGLSKDALIYGLGDALGKMIGLVLLPILTRIFGPADYGAIDILAISYTFLLVFVRFGVPSGVQRFYYRREPESRRILVSSSYAFMIVLAVIVAGALIALSGPLSRLVEGEPEVIRASIVLLAIAVPFELSWNYLVLLLRLRRNPVAFSLANTARVIMTPALTVVFVVLMEHGIVGVFRAKLITLALITSVVFIYARGEFCRTVRFEEFRRVVLFALPGHPGLLLKSVMNVLPRYVLAYFAPIAAVGLFGIAMRISSVMKIYVDAFNRAWNPFAYANEGAEDERRVYEVAFRAFALSLMLVAMVFCLFAPELLRLLTTARYQGAYPLVPGIVFYLGVDGLVLMFSTLLYTRNEVRWTSYLGAVKLVVFFVSSLILAPRFGAHGVVGSLVIASVVYGSSYALVTLRIFRFEMSGARLALLLICATALTFSLNQLDTLLVVVIAAKVLAILLLGWLGVLTLFSERERVRARSLLRHGLGKEGASAQSSRAS